MQDTLGDRMKNFYENVTRSFLPRRTYTIIRLDGKAFHSFTRGLDKPWDEDLISLMLETTLYLCKNIQGTKFAYTQSDEISILLTDFDNLETDAWFAGNIQKIVSVSSSIATFAFLKGMITINKNKFLKKNGELKEALFDSRTFTIPSKIEVINYFIWRQQDAIRNSIQMLAQHLYSQKELQGKKQLEMNSMCKEKGIDWNELPAGNKQGRAIYLIENEWIVDENLPVFSMRKDFIDKIIL